MSKVLIVMYSHTGTCRRLAQILRAQHSWPMTQVRDLRPRSGVWGTWRCALDSLLGRRPAIQLEGNATFDGFDAVVLIAPIWLSRIAGPMRSFVASNAKSLPKVALISVMGGPAAPAGVAELTSLLGRSPILETAFSAREVDDGSCAARLQAFGDDLRSAIEPAPPVRPIDWSAEAA
jgi:hypothetical protein